MEILMVAAELAPYCRAGEAGDSVAALSRTLQQLNNNVTVALPKCQGFEDSGMMVARRLTPLELGEGETATVYDGKLPSGVNVVLLEAADLQARAGVYGEGKDYPDNAKRFSVLSKAVNALVSQKAKAGEGFSIVHAHDWPGAFVALLKPQGSKVVFTVHDARRQGGLTLKDAEQLGLSGELRDRVRLGSRASLLKGGMLAADLVTTVSPSYAHELLDKEKHGVLASALQEAEITPHGVLGGIDYAIYNPATDTALAARFDAEAVHLKGNSKTALCRDLELDNEEDLPLVALTGDLDKDAGADLMVALLPELLKRELMLVVAGSGAKGIVKTLASAKLRRFDNYRFIETGEAQEFRRVIAAADIAVCPSRTRVSGRDPQVAQRYGAVPVALDVAGNRDAVVDCDAGLETGTGFLFDESSKESLLGGLERALSACRTSGWGRLRRRVMRQDLGWERAARRYEQLYRIALRS